MRFVLLCAVVLSFGLWQTSYAATIDTRGDETQVVVAATAATEEGQEPSTIEVALLDLANAERMQRGLAPLAFDLPLLTAARARAAAQVPLPRLSHYDASGQLALVHVFLEFDVGYRMASENLARLPGPAATAAERAHAALMASSGHRPNILEPTFDHLAVGSAIDPSGRLIFAQIFRAAP